MGDLAVVLRERVARARRGLRRAQVEGDAYGVEVFAAELEDLERRAVAHGITVGAPAADDEEGAGVGCDH